MYVVWVCWLFFFQAEDGIRDLVRSRGLGDVYKRQGELSDESWQGEQRRGEDDRDDTSHVDLERDVGGLSLIHI